MNLILVQINIFIIIKNNLELEFVEYNNQENKIIAKCRDEQNQYNEIKCKINDITNNDYSLKD